MDDYTIEGCTIYDPDFLTKDDADALFERLDKDTPWKQAIARFKTISQPLPRLIAWYGDPGKTYSYSGIDNDPLPWTEDLLSLRRRLSALSDFNSALLNRYKNGDDAIGFHCDNERELGRNPTIASITLGSPRTFQLKSKRTGERVSMKLGHGSLLIMYGRCQELYLHGVPREPAIVGVRINITFRTVV